MRVRLEVVTSELVEGDAEAIEGFLLNWHVARFKGLLEGFCRSLIVVLAVEAGTEVVVESGVGGVSFCGFVVVLRSAFIVALLVVFLSVTCCGLDR